MSQHRILRHSHITKRRRAANIASLAIWSSHKVAASFGPQPCSSGACIGGLMTGAIWNAVNGECRLMAHADMRAGSRHVRLRA
jgi:hypothetical protein